MLLKENLMRTFIDLLVFGVLPIVTLVGVFNVVAYLMEVQ